MYTDGTLDAVRSQLQRVSEYDLYEDRFDRAGVDVESIDSWEAFRSLPFLEAEDIENDLAEHGPEGSLYPDSAMLSFTPMDGDLAPVFDTGQDLDYQADVHETVFDRIGVSDGDRVINTFGYHVFGTGVLIHRGLEAAGAEVIPAGPGESERAAGFIEEYDVDVLVGNPSFALKLAQYDVSVDVFVGGGEPFTAVPGLRDRVKGALGCDTAVDYFGSRRASPVAVECSGERGLHVVTENVVVEVVDPDTDEVLEPGERGELVVTHVRKSGTPLVRYRTGDLAELQVEECPDCGATVTLPDGVIGRTDERLKVKGVKVYPGSIGTALFGFEGLTGEYRLEVSQPDATDHLRLVCEGEPGVDVESLRATVEDRLLIAPDEVEVVSELDEGPRTVDRRY